MPRRLSLALAVALHPSVAIACGPTPPAFDGNPAAGVSVSVGRITDRTWEPTWMAGGAMPADAGLTLTIGFDGKVEGATGCNRFTGTADLDAGWLQLGPLAVTEMACMEPDRMEREAAWLKALGETRGFVLSPDGLWLMRDDGSVAVCLE
jgi:heat shock protein HslJ